MKFSSDRIDRNRVQDLICGDMLYVGGRVRARYVECASMRVAPGIFKVTTGTNNPGCRVQLV